MENETGDARKQRRPPVFKVLVKPKPLVVIPHHLGDGALGDVLAGIPDTVR